MPSEPRTTADMLERAVGGITYVGGEDGSFQVVYEGRPTDTYVAGFRGAGPDAWIVGEFRATLPGGLQDWDYYHYRTLADFERAYIAREGEPRIPELGGAVTEYRIVVGELD